MMHRVFLKPFAEWGIALSLISQLREWKQQMAWKLIGVNIVVILVVIWLAGVSVKDFACVLVEKYRFVGEEKNLLFNQTMQFYLMRASLLAIVVAALIHYVCIKKMLVPLRRLAQSTRQLMEGTYPEMIAVTSHDEIGQLTKHFNDMTRTLKRTEENRKRMLSNISHDLRTPLSNLNGYLEALKSGVITGDRELYHSLLEESQHITRMVEQLHLLSVWEDRRETSMTKTSLQIDELISKSTNTFQWELKKRNMELNVSLEPGIVIGDEDGLRQVLNNLMQNAISYNTGRFIGMSGKSEPLCYRVTVSNVGEPMPEEVRELVFERFFQVDPSRQRTQSVKGSGLGLAIVKEVVQKHGGEVGLISEEDNYSFWITIPRSG
ncbi:sensor histidine kinase [Brevibacillus sp. NRS-1366]|uniref:sensor histidine kinase n=1 Tax=Brevibacillus sp. NRS-1366 TaxID=3233899 RepID=UPI003D1AD22B